MTPNMVNVVVWAGLARLDVHKLLLVDWDFSNTGTTISRIYGKWPQKEREKKRIQSVGKKMACWCWALLIGPH